MSPHVAERAQIGAIWLMIGYQIDALRRGFRSGDSTKMGIQGSEIVFERTPIASRLPMRRCGFFVPCGQQSVPPGQCRTAEPGPATTAIAGDGFISL
tara:strand:+ start:21951 stop:22241 length:291 start_codon:yes stop_codon:yes gene_type:complete